MRNRPILSRYEAMFPDANVLSSSFVGNVFSLRFTCYQLYHHLFFPFHL